MKKAIYAATYEQVYAISRFSLWQKMSVQLNLKKYVTHTSQTLGEIDDVTKFLAKKYYHDVEYDAIRNLVVLDEGKAFRWSYHYPNTPNLRSEVGYLPSAHGSAVFTRGETQSLTTVTLGAKDDEQMIDGAFINELFKNFFYTTISLVFQPVKFVLTEELGVVKLVTVTWQCVR